MTVLEPLINEYTLEEERQIVRDRLQFYNYVYFLDGVPVYVGKGFGKRATDKYRKRSEFFADRSELKYRIVFAHDDEAVIFANETALIKKIGRRELGTGPLRNKTNGGEGMAGIIMSEATRKKMGESRRGDRNHNFGKKLGPLNAEMRHRLSEANRGKQNTLGKVFGPYSEQRRKKIGDAQRGEKGNNWGKHASEETRRKIGNASRGNQYCLGKTLSAETRRKISEANRGENNPNFGKIFGPHTEEHKRKISKAMRGQPKSEETRQRMRITQRRLAIEKAAHKANDERSQIKP